MTTMNTTPSSPRAPAANPPGPQDPGSADRRERIAQRAFALWEQGGRPENCPDQYWYRAEKEVAAEEENAGRLRARLSPSPPPATSVRAP